MQNNPYIKSGVGIRSTSDYSPFGVQLDGRTSENEGYRYGFNSMEKDDEIKGTGNSYDFGARMYDARVGRWLSVDNKSSKYPNQSPYIFVNNRPIITIDPDGKSGIVTITEGVDGNPGTVKISMNLTIYGSGATAELATAMQVEVKKLFSENVKTIMVNGEVYNFELDLNVQASTYEAAFMNARGSLPNSTGNDSHLENFVRVENFNQRQEDEHRLGSRSGKVSEWREAGSNSGFFITSSLSDPTVAAHEIVHGLLLVHDDAHLEGPAPSLITPTNAPASSYPNLLDKNKQFNEEKGFMVINPKSRVPYTEEVVKILKKTGYEVSSDGKGIINVVFENGTSTKKIGSTTNEMYNRKGKVDNKFNNQDKDPNKD